MMTDQKPLKFQIEKLSTANGHMWFARLVGKAGELMESNAGQVCFIDSQKEDVKRMAMEFAEAIEAAVEFVEDETKGA